MAKYYNLCLIEINHGIEKFVFDKLSKDIDNEFNINSFVSELDSNLFEYI